jgi:hypothetical protein
VHGISRTNHGDLGPRARHSHTTRVRTATVCHK